MVTFDSAGAVRKFLRSRGIDVTQIRLRGATAPWSGGCRYFHVEAKNPDGPIASYSGPDDSFIAGRKGSKTVVLLTRIKEASIGTNIIV